MAKKAYKIKDKETGAEVTIGRDGRKMHPTSLKNVDNTNNPHKWKPGESGNINGGPKSADKLFKQELIELMKGEDWTKKSKEEQTILVKNVWKKAIDKYMTTDNDNTFLRLLELFVGSTDGKAQDSYSKDNPIVPLMVNVVQLPPKNEPIEITTGIPVPGVSPLKSRTPEDE